MVLFALFCICGVVVMPEIRDRSRSGTGDLEVCGDLLDRRLSVLFLAPNRVVPRLSSNSAVESRLIVGDVRQAGLLGGANLTAPAQQRAAVSRREQEQLSR